jgi:hypothetical protein
MKIIKPNNNKHAVTLDPDDDFFKQSHGLPTAGAGEHTLCGFAAEEWLYEDFSTRKRITCPECLELIDECKGYKP